MIGNRNNNRHLTPSILLPPERFMSIDDNLYRAVYPLTRQHIPFLHQAQISTIINLSEDTNGKSLTFLTESPIIQSIHNVYTDEDFPFSSTSVSNSEDCIKKAIELTLNSSNVLLLGSDKSCVDGVVIACIRRLQGWTLTSIIEEFRILTGRKIFDIEQFIEYFDIDIIDVPNIVPDYLQIYDTLLEEELELLQEIEISSHQIRVQSPSSLSSMVSKESYGTKDDNQSKVKDKDKDNVNNNQSSVSAHTTKEEDEEEEREQGKEKDVEKEKEEEQGDVVSSDSGLGLVSSCYNLQRAKELLFSPLFSLRKILKTSNSNSNRYGIRIRTEESVLHCECDIQPCFALLLGKKKIQLTPSSYIGKISDINPVLKSGVK
eukprot:gene1249-2421_t